MHKIFQRLVLCMAFAIAAGFPSTAQSTPSLQDIIALKGATLVDAEFDGPIENGVILISDGQIIASGPASAVTIPEGAEIVDITGRWVMPGLVDAHMHFAQSGGLYTRPDGLDLRDVRAYEDDRKHSSDQLPVTFRRYLASGVTAVVDVGGPSSNFAIREHGETLAPQISMAGPLLATLTPAFAERVARLDLDGDRMIIRVLGPDDGRARVRAQLANKPDLIKIWYIASFDRPAEDSYATVKAIIDEAHKSGVRVAVHATQLETARLAVKAGADILVHTIDDAPVDDALVAALKENDVIVTTTAVVYEHIGQLRSREVVLTPLEIALGDPVAIASWEEAPEASKRLEIGEALEARVALILENLKTLADAGVRVAVGTDAGNPGTLHGPSIHRELALLEGAGFSPAQILRAATLDAAAVFSRDPDFASLAPGKRADLLVLGSDPMAGVAGWQDIETVIIGGVRYDPDQIAPLSPAGVVQRQLEAYNAHDIEAFLATYSDDIELFNLPEPEAQRSGIETMRAVYGRLFTTLKPNCRLLSRTVQGNYVIDQEFCQFGDNTVRATATYQVEDGLIRRVWFAR